MALSISTNVIGIDFPTAYVRLDEVRLNGKTEAQSYFVVFTDDTAQHVIGGYSVNFHADPAPDAPNIHTQAYAAAKLLPELADAVDV